MKNIDSLTIHLCAVVREDLIGQERLYVALQAQEQAVVAHNAGALEEATVLVANQLEAISLHSAKRASLMQDFADQFSVACGTVTLGSIAARLGESGHKLAELRLELRDIVERVNEKNRRVSALVSMHRNVTNEILETVLADGDGNPIHERGVLLDAEA
jgi:hypothetical protein